MVSSPFAFDSDPLIPAQQWVFDQINVEPVWSQNIFGTGIRVRINDDGVDSTNVEFKDRFDVNASCDIYEPETGQTNNVQEDDHGTAVASIVGGGGNNGVCGVGVAPGVILSSCNAFARQGVETFTGFDIKMDQMDISQNSIGVLACTNPNEEVVVRRRRRLLRLLDWDYDETTVEDEDLEGLLLQAYGRELQNNPCPFLVDDADTSPCTVCDFNSSTTATQPTAACEQAIVKHCDKYFDGDEVACLDFLDLLIGGDVCDFNKIPESMLDAITNGITQGRDGKGIIYVFASGNNYRIGDNVNFGGLTNSRLTVTVAAVGKDEKHASYSTPGAAVVVSAPGGDSDSVSNHVTAIRGGGCNAASTGTSFAAPVVSGVIALMLQVNPNLSWRDVQGVLAATSRVKIDENDSTLVTNGAGLSHSNLYGFGIVDAYAAVQAAKKWRLYCAEKFLNVESGPVNAVITDASSTTPINSTVTVTQGAIDVENFVVESVVVLLDVQHFSRGDLEIVLTSPSGTVSILVPGRRPEHSQLAEGERWKLMTVRNWGESPIGNWTLSVRDLRVDDPTECIDLPYRTTYLNSPIDCPYIRTQGLCINGAPDPATFGSGEDNELLTFRFEGFTMQEACCACGGGFTTNDFQDTLRQWRLVVYGRDGDCEVEKSEPVWNLTESVYPSNTPTRAPSEIPAPKPTSKAPTKSSDPPESSAEADPTAKAATIGASIGAFILACCCTYLILRDPSSSKNRFTSIGKSGTNHTAKDDFDNVDGEIA